MLDFTVDTKSLSGAQGPENAENAPPKCPESVRSEEHSESTPSIEGLASGLTVAADLSCADALASWDAGRTVTTVEMGGLGDSYEHAIQSLAFELIRENLGKPLPADDDGKWGDDVAHRLADEHGFSGAQVGAAKSLAFRCLRYGYGAAILSAPEDRLIQWTKTGPATAGAA